MRSNMTRGNVGLVKRGGLAWGVRVAACALLMGGGAFAQTSPALPAAPENPQTPAIQPAPIKPKASPGLIETPFSDLSFDEARRESIRRDRLLVVVDPSSRFYNEEAWMHPSVRAFVMWKAIVIKGRERPSPFRRQYNIAGTNFYIGGEQREDIFVKIDGNTARFMEKTQVRVGPLGLLLGMDYVIDLARSRDPLWGLRHDDKNPMPAMPDREAPMFDASDGVAIAVSDLTRADGIEGVLRRLEEARAAVVAGDRDLAIGLYTWLMERSAQVEPSFDPVRLFVVAPEFAVLTPKYPAAMSRATALFERARVRMPWAGPAEWFELGATAECARRNADVLMEMQGAMGDMYEESAMSRTAMAEIKLITSRIGNSMELVPTADATVKEAEKGLKTSMPAKVRVEDWEQLQATRKWLIRAEGCRAYGALLAAGKQEDAARIAAVVRSVHGAEGTRALVITALAHGQARAEHRRWLDEAGVSSKDGLRAALEARVKSTD